jgi:hypothetical protein
VSSHATKALASNEVSYLLEARILGVNPNRLAAVRFGHQDATYLRPPTPPSRLHNPFGDDFCLSTLQIGARGA